MNIEVRTERHTFPMTPSDGIFRSTFQSESAYHRTELRWAELWEQIPESKHWTSPWLNTTYGDGRPMLTGDGILSAKHPEMGRALKIIQQQDDDAPLGQVTWWQQQWDPDDENLTVLVIVVVPSTEALAVCSELLSAWAKGEVVEISGDRSWNE